jgi:hypothetical protein
MKSLCAIGAVALVCSSILSADEVKAKDHITLTSETLSLPELLSYIEDTVSQLVDSDEETCQIASHELKESLKIVYTINCLHPTEAATILQVLDECYADLTDAMDRDPGKANILEQSLSLFASGRNYDHETLAVQPLQDWADMALPSELKSAIEATDADLVYIQDNVMRNIRKDESRFAFNTSAPLLYSTSPSLHSSPKILIIKHKSDDSSEYKVEGKVKMRLGGKDHGKISSEFGAEAKDKSGNYASAKVSKEKGDDGYDVEVNAGKEKK